MTTLSVLLNVLNYSWCNAAARGLSATAELLVDE